MPRRASFLGWRVVWSAFVLAVFGWGVGFYGPPVFLHHVVERTGWPLALVSAAVTVHFLIGAVAGANLPRLHGRFGVAPVTVAGALALCVGVVGWAMVAEPWQLFVAALLGGSGWAAMSAAAINAILAPWFVRARPAALATAYNGGSIGGVIFAPLWVALIDIAGFVAAAAVVGSVMLITVWALSCFVFSLVPERLGLAPDGDAPGAAPSRVTAAHARPLPGSTLWADRAFLTLAAGMGLGLFAQIGLVAHLFSVLVPVLGARPAGLAMGLATACAIAGRTAVGRLMPVGADRRLIAGGSYAVQAAGSLLLVCSTGQSAPLLLAGVILFGVGFGNATSLPPLIAQVEFVEADVLRVVSLIVAIGQAIYAFAPALFGLLRTLEPGSLVLLPGHATLVFVAAAIVQLSAIACLLAGRR
jgi:MFS family permease